VRRPVASGNRENVDLQTTEVVRDSIELLDRVGRANDAAITDSACEALGGAGVAQVVPALGVYDNTDAGHERERYGPRVPQASTPDGSTTQYGLHG